MATQRAVAADKFRFFLQIKLRQRLVGHSQIAGELLVEFIDHRHPGLALGDLIQLIFQPRGEVHRQHVGEVLHQQVRDD